MAIAVFDEFLKEFEQPITQFVSNSVQNLTSYVDAPLRVAVMLYIVIYGIAVMRGAIQEPILDFAWRAIRIVTVILLATNAASYQQYVTALFFDSLPREISGAIAGGGLDMKSGQPFDQLLTKGISVAQKIYDQAGLTDIVPALVAAILLVFTAVSGFLQFAIMLYAKVGLALVLALGPIFIALMLFEATRTFGEAWTRQLANFVILHVLVVALIGLMLTTVGHFVDKYGANATTGGQLIVGAVAISAVLGLAAYIALQLPEIAGALAGGGASLAAHMLNRWMAAYATTATAAATIGAYAGASIATARTLRALRGRRAGGGIRHVPAE
ncbi:type IV secretion system protein [Methylocystis sp. H62]|uniref:type IV secretion system protein n=1 Tax=Methylocystis sp. H62 TaxID=2785789 RepID=UPI0018C2E857|nr:type IV secretion system protein [Methylocystis sp. H62]MBG0792484.1 type IV secretion system protein [Methylocystis sp. H62]